MADDFDATDFREDGHDMLPKLYGSGLKNEQDVYLFQRLAFMTRDAQ